VFKGLRLSLTATYVAAALGLVLLMGLGTYGLLRYYFQSDNDDALRYQVVLEYESLGIELPQDLETAKSEWQSSHTDEQADSALPPGLARQAQDTETDDSTDDSEDSGVGPPWKAYPDSELAPLFVLHLDPRGVLLVDPSAEGESPTPIADGFEAAAAAPDIRTATLTDGREVRVATYHLPPAAVSASQPVAYIQVGRLLSDQSRVLGQILLTVLLACGGAAIAVGLASWFLAGRSLRPARHAWEQQQVFIANASHELRAPVTLIRASAEYALRTHSATGAPGGQAGAQASAEPQVAEVLRDVITETDHLSRLVDDLVLLSRMDAGKIDLEIRPLAAAELFSDVSRSFGRLAEEKGVTLQTSSDDAVARGDYTRVRQIILILLDNALRHAPPGSTITLDARAEARRIAICVADTGNGIAPKDLPHVFDRFYQVRSGPGDRRGSGLGLSIARSMAEALKGRIDIASRLGEGTRVTLYLPREGT
jgi:signal transduction histidine kinase